MSRSTAALDRALAALRDPLGLPASDPLPGLEAQVERAVERAERVADLARIVEVQAGDLLHRWRRIQDAIRELPESEASDLIDRDAFRKAWA